MVDKFTIGILLLAFVLSVSLTVYEAGRIKELEERVSVLAVQTEEAEKKGVWKITGYFEGGKND